MVQLSAGSLPAEIDVVAPAALHQAFFLTDVAAGRTRFEQVGHNMAGNLAPGFEHFIFFPNFI